MEEKIKRVLESIKKDKRRTARWCGGWWNEECRKKGSKKVVEELKEERREGRYTGCIRPHVPGV